MQKSKLNCDPKDHPKSKQEIGSKRKLYLITQIMHCSNIKNNKIVPHVNDEKGQQKY